MANTQLKIAYDLAGRCDHTTARLLLEQYGLRCTKPDASTGLAVVVGAMPQVLSAMNDIAIEEHLATRIEDSAPGTVVTRIEATIVVDERKAAL